MVNPTDLSLVAQVAVAGNKRAFDELVRRYQSSVRRFLLNLTLGDGQLADDLAQDTFLKAYLNIGSFRGLSGFKTWLMRIAYNVFYDHTRVQSSKFMVHSSDLQQAQQSNDELCTMNYELKNDLYTALAMLKDEERTCITLQLIDGYDIAHISDITQLKPNTVKSHLARGKERLANYLRKNGYGQS